MPRAIVYAPDSQRVRAADAGGEADTLPSKLTKYVPAEVLAFYVPTYANLPDSAAAWRWAVFGIGLVGTVLYLLATRLREQQTRGPWYFYALAGVAYVGWAVSVTSAGGDLFGLDEGVTPAILATTVLLVPIVDELVTRFWPAA